MLILTIGKLAGTKIKLITGKENQHTKQAPIYRIASLHHHRYNSNCHCEDNQHRQNLSKHTAGIQSAMPAPEGS